VLQCVAMCCSVLQRVESDDNIYDNMLPCVAMCCSVLQCVVARYSVLGVMMQMFLRFPSSLQSVCCNVLQCVAMCCSVLQRVAEFCSVLQRVAECCRCVFGRLNDIIDDAQKLRCSPPSTSCAAVKCSDDSHQNT